jgi:putative SOS response-associated peptidase YedK
MPDSYALYEIEKLTDHFHLKNGLPKGVRRRYNIRPTQMIPVIVNRESDPTVELMKWGFIPQGAKDSNSVFRYKTHVAKSEIVFEKPIWSTAIRAQRCIIPANGFFGFKQPPTGKKAYFIRPKHHPLISFAGLYSSWTDPTGKIWSTCALLTTTANAETAGFKMRIPVILSTDDEVRWLDTTKSDMNTLYDMMRQSPDGSFSSDEVSIEAMGGKIDSPHLVSPLSKIR